MAQHIGEVAILVRDYDEALLWFTRKLGFIVKEDSPLPDGERWVRVGPRNGQTALRLARAKGDEQAAQIGRQAGGRVLCYLHTEDFRSEYAALLERGVRFTEAPRHESYGTVAVFVDLCGNRWDLVEHRNEHRAPSR